MKVIIKGGKLDFFLQKSHSNSAKCGSFSSHAVAPPPRAA